MLSLLVLYSLDYLNWIDSFFFSHVILYLNLDLILFQVFYLSALYVYIVLVWTVFFFCFFFCVFFRELVPQLKEQQLLQE